MLSAQPSYKPELNLPKRAEWDVLDGFQVRRLSLSSDRGTTLQRVRNVMSFCLQVSARVLIAPRRDVVMCSTYPPVLLAFCVSVVSRWRRSSFVYHCMDIHPEIGRLSGEFRQPGVFGLLRRMDLAVCRAAAAIVVLSDDMKRALVARDPALAPKVWVINNFDLPATGDASPSRDEPWVARSSETLRVVFTGNIGRFQALDEVVDGVLEDREELDRVELVLMGEGAAKADLERRVALAAPEVQRRVTLLPHGTTAQARRLMRDADLGLVSLVPNVVGHAYPSKTATYLAEGLPVLLGVERNSALSTHILAVGAGVEMGTPSAHGVAATLAWCADHIDEVRSMRPAALRAWRNDFNVEDKLRQWDELLEAIA